jgi:hypothetical protein
MESNKQKKFSFNKKMQKFLQRGQTSRLLLVLAIIVLVAVVIVYLITNMYKIAPTPPNPNPDIPQPMYEKTLGNVKFIFEGAIDMGDTLDYSNAMRKDDFSYNPENSIHSTERFIKVTVGAQNKGKETIESGAWILGNLVDSEGRQFEPADDYSIDSWLPQDNACGAALKPEFDPVPCTKIYEVSKASTGLQLTVGVDKGNGTIILSADDKESDLMDLIIN